jgi:hypothetical protein
MTMAIPARQRWVVYAIALLLTLAGVRWAGGQDPAEPRAAAGDRVERPDRPAREPSIADAVPEVRLDRLKRHAGAGTAGDPFQARSWEAPVAAARRSLPPPPPQAPPLPFTYLGKMIDGPTTTLFLSRQDRNFVVRPGDTLDGAYRVDAIEEGGVTLTYLPLGARQTLAFAAPAAFATPTLRAKAAVQDPDDEDEE